MAVENINKRLIEHERRIRDLELSMSAIPRIEKKLDRILDEGYDTSLSVQEQRVKTLEKDVEEVKLLARRSENNWNEYKKIFGIVATVIIAAAIAGLFGVDITTLF